MTQNKPVNNNSLITRIDMMKVSGWHWYLVLLCMSGIMIENFDAMSLSMAMPIITKSWKLAPSMIGVLLSATALGMLIGATVFGVLADLIGRKKTFITTTVVFSLFVCISVFAKGFSQLYTLRVLAGIGLGGFIPVGMAYISEFSPVKVRGRFIGIFTIGNGVGYVAAVLTSMFVVRSMAEGWRIVFAVGGVAGLIIIPLMAASLPESVRWLLSKKKIEAAVNTVELIEKKALGEITVPHDLALAQARESENIQTAKKVGLSSLFTKKTLGFSLLSIILWFVSSYTFFGFIQWMPTFLTKNMGYSLTTGYWFTLIAALVGTGTPGLAVGFASDFWGKKRVLIICMLSYAAAGCLFLWFGGWLLLPLYWFSSAMSSQLYIYTPDLFPTTFRGSGLGVSSAIGRFAQFIAPMIIGLSVAAKGLAGVIYINGGMLLIAVLAMIVLDRESKSQSS